MRILIVRMWPDNLNINSYNCQEIGLAKALIKMGNICDIVLYTSDKEREEIFSFDNDSKFIRLYYLKAKKFLKNAFYGKKLYEICKNYDCIQSAEYDQIGNLLLRRRFNNLCIYHGPYLSKFTKGYNKKIIISDLLFKFFPKYKHTPIISKSKLATDFLHMKGFSNVTTLGVGIDLERFNNKSNIDEKVEFLLDQKKKDNLKYLLYIGKIEKRRNIGFILQRFKDVLNEDESIRLIIVGDGNKEDTDEMYNTIQHLALKDYITHLKKLKQEELQFLYNNCDVFLLPTQYEIFGMVMLEAMYFKMPIITTRNGGSSTLINNNKNGFIIDLADSEKWDKCILTLLNDEDYKKRIGNKARDTIINYFTWEKLSKKFLKVYSKISDKKI